MVRDPHDAVADDAESAPRMLRRPAEAPPRLEHLGDREAVMSLRRVMSDRNAGGGSFRGWAARVSGRADRRLLLAVAGATDAVAAYCDLLVDRLAAQEAVTADVAGSFGQEIALLRAEVLHLQRTLATLQDPRP
jgi:hypothetical protein